MTQNANTESNELINDFVDEGIESMQGLPAQLESYAVNPANADSINAVFRAIHSIKGCAGFLGVVAIKLFAHSLENTLDDVRKQRIALSPELTRLLIQGFDLLTEQLQRCGEGAIEGELSPAEAELLDAIAKAIAGSGVACTKEELILAELEKLSDEIRKSGQQAATTWAERMDRVVFRFRGDTETAPENEGTATVGKPRPHGYVTGQFTLTDADVSEHVFALANFFVSLDTQNLAQEQAEAFYDTARQLAALASEKQNAGLATAMQTAEESLRTLVNSPLDVDASLSLIVWDQIVDELTRLKAGGAEPTPAPAEKQPESSEKEKDKKNAKRMLRVKEESIDHFFDHVSRLFISCERFKDLHLRMAASEAPTPLVEELRQITREFVVQSQSLQQSVVVLRQVPVSALFSKFPRMARSLGAQLGKQIDVHLSGEDLDIDKSLVEDLDAPLTHMVRNVVDHGIETPEDRQSRGVSEVGNLWLRAEKTRSHLVITIQDDGRGIDPNKLRKKAVEKGIYSEAEAAALTDQQAVELIYHAGFSTAEKVSEVSGRGVGMDVVVTNLREHNGEIYVSSQVGVGTTFRLEIPKREAVVVIDSLMLKHSGDVFALPFNYIREIVELGPDDLKSVFGDQYVATVRGKIYDAVSLESVLGLAPSTHVHGTHRPAVLVECKTGTLCLLIDEVLNHKQVVVNSLRQSFPSLEAAAGVAQMGGGRMAIVLEVPEILKTLSKRS